MSRPKPLTQRRSGRSAAGFSLIEMLVATGIMATLLAVGVPKYKKFTATARQSEAKNNLSHIFTLEQAYTGDEGTFANMGKVGPTGSCNPGAPIGFTLQPCSTSDWKVSRYYYEVTGANDVKFDAFAKTGTGNSNLVSPGCARVDEWKLNEQKLLTAVSDTSGC